MEYNQSNMLWIGLFFLGLFLSGFWVYRSGKPYPAIVFNIHKFIALAAAIYLGATVYRVQQQTPLVAREVAALVITAAFFIINIVAGGLLNTNVPRQKALLTIHHVFPYLTIISTAITFYLILPQ